MPIYVRVYFIYIYIYIFIMKSYNFEKVQYHCLTNIFIHSYIHCIVECVDITGTIISGWWSITRCLFLKLPNLVLVFSLSWNKYR